VNERQSTSSVGRVSNRGGISDQLVGYAEAQRIADFVMVRSSEDEDGPDAHP